MKLLYKPFAIFAGVIGHRTGRTAFKAVWSHVADDEGPPSPRAGHVSLAKVAGAAALQAGTIAGIGAAIDQLAARAFHHLFGAWPEKPAEPEQVPAEPAPAAPEPVPAATE